VFRNIKIAGLCLASMLVMGMALAGNAAAALLWLVCLKGVGLTKYENSKCLKSKEPQTRGEEGWQSLGLLPGQTATIKILVLSLKLVDTGTPLGEAGVLCLDTPAARGEGVIEEKGKGKIRAAEVEKPEVNCTGLGACKKATKLEGANLPWATEIVEGPGGAPLTKIKSGGSGEPGWKITCETSIGTLTDTCLSKVGEEEEVRLTFGEVTENPAKEKELLLRGLFEEKRTASCSLGNSTSGKVLGTLALLLPGGALSINKV
jgi:hypothetical protein